MRPTCPPAKETRTPPRASKKAFSYTAKAALASPRTSMLLDSRPLWNPLPMSTSSSNGASLGRFLGVEAVSGVQHAHRELGLVLVDQPRDLDLAGGDRLDV